MRDTGALCYALFGTSPASINLTGPEAPATTALTDDVEESAWPTALEHTHYDKLLESEAARATPRLILYVLRDYRAVFPDKLPPGLPPRRPYDQRTLLVTGKLPSKSTKYRRSHEQLQAHKIARLSANG